MKKTYINPSIEVVKIQTNQMLAESNFRINTTEVDGGSALGREYILDFEDEEF